ncbi:hypothetical protein [Methylomonas sp. HYX-M1]|uniref:hypothetical protein n=1 Tax=Methylomonas sp. HYX-M1 TaxID=3139307 RepID=UPI00345B8F16
MNIYSEKLNEASRIVGGFEKLGRVCGLTGKAVKKWAIAGRPPRTEYTGETQYAELISKAVDGEISVDQLRPSLSKPSPIGQE